MTTDLKDALIKAAAELYSAVIDNWPPGWDSYNSRPGTARSSYVKALAAYYRRMDDASTTLTREEFESTK